MNWIKVRRALLYGQPKITHDTLQPQVVKTAVREIARLVNFGWIDEMPEDTLQRIKTACDIGECQEIWEEFPRPKKVSRRRKSSRKTAKSKKR